MPPRVRSSKFSSAITSCPPPRPKCTTQCRHTSREARDTKVEPPTVPRRKFYAWLEGPGAQLKRPLPGSTNYLGAYDRYGNIVRADAGWDRKKAQNSIEVNERWAKKRARKVDAVTTENPAGQDAPADPEKSAISHERDPKWQEKFNSSQLPPEAEEDLRPFPLNQHFRSQPVLSEHLREHIYQRVSRDGAPVKLASVEFGVSNERVGAVVRLKQMEKEWLAQGKHLALPYSKAVLGMLPQTPFIDQSLPENKDKRPIPHEPINDLIVHPATRQQLFVPVAESRRFTRADAGKAFQNDLLPADDRIPHPELVDAEREIAQGLSFRERQALATARHDAEEEAKRVAEETRRAEELRTRKTVPQRRWDYVFTDVSVEQAGKNGRGAKGVGWRYGFPHEDRKKGMVKIPTKVEA
ncbi:eukaryotic mitochondrial regulator protein-domain-containing protein [Dendryphion nanum]|uniref:Eukaryotic mitochondrial regulator protein-domain-containing protein n=1 Tax=Dendryphion nanum TaxID=256645 RepID=A0A9P9IBA7_9PLEO|nr:eukaryotic mitochondrial regulator protein-domain-containing protein [Dendryphion nanum]